MSHKSNLNTGTVYCIMLPMGDGSHAYLRSQYTITYSKDRAHKWLTRGGAERTLEHMPNYVPFKGAFISEI